MRAGKRDFRQHKVYAKLELLALEMLFPVSQMSLSQVNYLFTSVRFFKANYNIYHTHLFNTMQMVFHIPFIPPVNIINLELIVVFSFFALTLTNSFLLRM